MNKQIEEIAWSVYWAQDQLHSCVPAAQTNDQQCLVDLWQKFAKTLASDAKVLDLATGNGAVPVVLLGANPEIQVIAVDRAEIDPTQFVSDTPELHKVEFHPNVDIQRLPFEDDTMDAITSQFGIEYAGLLDAIEAALPKLKSNGELLFVIHNTDSEILATSAKKIVELEQLLKSNGPIENLLLMLQGKIQFEALEQAGREHMQSEAPKTEMISGQVFAGIESVANLLQHGEEEDIQKALKLGASLSLRANSELSRLIQMREAAQDQEQMEQLKSRANTLGIDVLECRPLYVNEPNKEYLLAWVFRGKKI